jgi:predicted SAM-dependent methyltransferase
MKYLNIGCGYHYIKSSEWVNIDFSKTGDGVIAHNLLSGIPFAENTFDFVYHSHVLEHFTKDDGIKLIKECYRVLKPGGILRIAIPNLESIVREYISVIDKLSSDIENPKLQENYEWIMLEMYDQTVRNQSGGKMAEFLNRPNLKDADFVIKRIGTPATTARNAIKQQNGLQKVKNTLTLKKLISRIKNRIMLIILGSDYTTYARIGKFRLGGEIHQWMYDRIALTILLKNTNFKRIEVKDGINSYLKNWANYELDGKEAKLRKADSLFIEGIK